MPAASNENENETGELNWRATDNSTWMRPCDAAEALTAMLVSDIQFED